MPACLDAQSANTVADKSAPDAEADAMRAQRVAALRIFCQARPSRGSRALLPRLRRCVALLQFAVVPSVDGAGWAFDHAGCRAQVSLGRREAHENSAFLAFAFAFGCF